MPLENAFGGSGERRGVTAGVRLAMNRAMRVCPTTLSLLACALIGACSNSSSSSAAPILASARIGPAGGLVAVESGKQRGLVLEIPAGVLTETIEFRITDRPSSPLPPGAVISAPQFGYPFRVEPAALVVDTKCRLRMPYLPSDVSAAGPGPVVVNQVSPFTVREYDPENLSVAEAWVEIGIKTFGEFQVRMGPRASSLLDYTPPIDQVAMLTGGFAFVVEPELTASPFVDPSAQQWRITGPLLDESVIFVNGLIVGRRSELQNWLEIWDEPYGPYQTPGTGFVIPQPGTMEVQAPIGSLGVGASLMQLGSYVYGEPREYNGGLQLDILKLTINVAYNRADIGSGERQLTFWLSPIEGLLSVMIDGIVYDRIP